jgi:RNA polymerase sigma factor (TIGR02999 family)
MLPRAYEALRALARRMLFERGGPKTIEPTELIHEADVRLCGPAAPDFEGRTHFARVAARAMRNVLVVRARRRGAQKRGGAGRGVTLDTQLGAIADESEALLSVHEGLEHLARVDAQLAEIVELRFFGGMRREEIATALGVSPRSVDRGWRTARAWWLEEYAPEA